MGLGDTSYEQFNEMAISSDKALTAMGAVRIGEIGAANAETYTTEDDFIEWKENLWTKIIEHFAKTDSEPVLPKPTAKPVTDPSVLPWVVTQTLEEVPEVEYALNMRNYQKSADVTISHCKEMRQ